MNDMMDYIGLSRKKMKKMTKVWRKSAKRIKKMF